MGSIINGIAIVIGGFIGLLLKKGIKDELKQSLFQVIGIGVFLIGLAGTLTNMLYIVDNKLKSNGELLLMISLIVGVFIGELLKIDDFLNGLGKKIEDKFHLVGFASSFVNASIIFIVGAMGIVGSIEEGLFGNYNILVVKSFIDGITSIIFGATLGVGVVFASIPVMLYQGSITLLASQLSTILVGDLLRDLCIVGYALVMSIGLNFLLRDKIKIANCLPSLLIVILYHLLIK